MQRIRRFFAAAAILASLPSVASLVEPGDGPYSRWRRGPILYVYDPTTEESVTQISAYMQRIRELYDQSFGWKLDEEEDLVLASPAQEVANAYATISPNIKSFWYPSGPALLEQMAQSSWFLTLATHETSHLYQLNAKGEVNSRLKTVFGSSEYVVPFVWPLFIHPNLYTPTFLIEGNAVFNESRANMGGRLYSGEVRALTLAQIKAGQINPTRLINNEFRFPYGDQAYFQGGYFQAHLAGKYGVDKTNQFFLAQGDHYLWPFILNRTFREHFGASYPQEIREYLREMDGLAQKQRTGVGPEMAKAQFFSPLNHDDGKIFYLASDGIATPELHVFIKATANEEVRRLDLPLGKVFYPDGGAIETAATEQHDLHHLEYSLYGEDSAFDPRYRGQIVNDQRGANTASLDAASSWLEPHVLLNGEPYDIGHSLPILDTHGNVYYFRQNGGERILYKNRQPVLKYDGFYGKLTEAYDDAVYFIANTDCGSSLYEIQHHEIFRVLDSDVVVDARRIDDGHFLAVEVGADGHRSVVLEAKRRAAQPALYSYGFPSYNLLPDKLVDPDQFKEERRPYNSVGEMRYSSLDSVFQYDSADGFNLYLNGLFTDPLEYQTLNLGFYGSQFGSQSFLGGYSFTKYLAQPMVRYLYQKQVWHQDDGTTRNAYNQQIASGLNLPLLRWRHWDAMWNPVAVYQKNQFHDDFSSGGTTASVPNVEETYGAWNSLNLEYIETGDPDLGFYPWRTFVMNYQNRLESEPGAWRKKYNTSEVQSKVQIGFPLEFYGTLSGQVAWAENNDVRVDYEPQPLALDIRIPRLVPHDAYTVKTASAARFEFTKVFKTPLYSARIPVGLDRIAPFLVAQAIFLDDGGAGRGGYPSNIFEWGYGVDVQLLVFHLAEAKLRLLNAFDTRDPQTVGSQAELDMAYKF